MIEIKSRRRPARLFEDPAKLGLDWQSDARAMTGVPGHKRSQHLIEAEAYRRIMSGELPGTLSEFALQLSNWFGQTHPDGSPITIKMVEDQIRETWHRRHELIRGG